jgi:hypothetical protein
MPAMDPTYSTMNVNQVVMSRGMVLNVRGIGLTEMRLIWQLGRMLGIGIHFAGFGVWIVRVLWTN